MWSSWTYLTVMAVGGLLAIGLPSAQAEEEAALGERLRFPGFSLQPPAGYDGPEIRQQRPAHYLSWIGPRRRDASQPLFQLTVTDIDEAPDWIGYENMTLGQLTDHFVQEIARTTIGFKAGTMKEITHDGITFRQVPFTCQIKSTAMTLVPVKGWVMATREGNYLYTFTARDKQAAAAQTLPVMSQAAASFRWEATPQDQR